MRLRLETVGLRTLRLVSCGNVAGHDGSAAGVSKQKRGLLWYDQHLVGKVWGSLGDGRGDDDGGEDEREGCVQWGLVRKTSNYSNLAGTEHYLFAVLRDSLTITSGSCKHTSPAQSRASENAS